MSIKYTSNFSVYGDFHNSFCHTNILNTVHIVLHAGEADVQGKSMHWLYVPSNYSFLKEAAGYLNFLFQYDEEPWISSLWLPREIMP